MGKELDALTWLGQVINPVRQACLSSLPARAFFFCGEAQNTGHLVQSGAKRMPAGNHCNAMLKCNVLED